MKRPMRLVVSAALLAGCATGDTSDLPRLELDVRFDQKNKCRGVSPEIRLTHVPPHVALYEIRVTDLDVPGFSHWNETLAANGPVIPEGAGIGYQGPCPPFGQHRYEITVTARGAQGQPVAYGEKIVPVAR